MKIRIFALAKELGLDSKELIQTCIDAGLDIKNSPLASISEEERDMILGKLSSSAPPSKAPSAPADPLVPVRKPTDAARLREIKTLSPPASQVTRRGPRKDSPFQKEEELAAAQAESGTLSEPETTEAAIEPEIEQEVSAEGATAEIQEVAPPAPSVVEEPAEVEVPAKTIEEPQPTPAVPVVSEAPPIERKGPLSKHSEAKQAETPAAPAPIAPPAGSAPMTRSDYIPPGGGGGGLAGMREMRARGSIRPGETSPGTPATAPRAEAPIRPPKKDKKKGPALPALATPTFKGTAAPKKHEGPVQKPDLAITGDFLKTNKLADILRKNRDDLTKKKTVQVEDEVGTGKGKQRSLGLEEARELRRTRRQKARGDAEDEEAIIVKAPKRHRRSVGGAAEYKTSASVSSPITVRSLSEAMGRPANELQRVMFMRGQKITINDALDEETAIELAMELGVDLSIEREEDVEDILSERLNTPDTDLGVPLYPRPPIITVLGHVDHGKTTLVDRLRSSNVVAGEAGGITQHIAAYQVDHNGQKLTFVDTPGHAAFGEMRARGANVTDIVVLVVAADDGVMPQTIECIAHAKAAGVPIVVAMNKMDLPTANEQKVLTDLSQHGILASEWGGDTEVVRISALKGTGIDNLLETLLLTAELNEYQTATDLPADGVCLEAFRDEGRGPLAWVIIRRGTLKVGDIVLCGATHGRVRAMYTDRGEEITEAGPSTPIKLAGLDAVPNAGDHLYVFDDIDITREIAEQRAMRGRSAILAKRGGPKSLELFFAERDGGVKDLPLIIKADTQGSIEALKSELQKIDHPEVRVKVLHDGVGGVNESDVYLAASAGAIIIAFHVIPEDRAESLAHQEGIQVRRYNIIYNVTDDIRKALEGLLTPERVEVPTGRALVLRTFSISRVGTVAGCRILNGTIERTNRVHVIRDQKILNDYSIASLKREKDDVREIREGFECGIRLEGFNDVKEGDLLEAYKIEERKRSLDD